MALEEMTIEEKNEKVIEYINKQKKFFEEVGHPVSEEKVNNVINMYTNSNKSFDEIKKEIDEMIERKIDEIRKFLESIANKEKQIKEIKDLNIDNSGITLNEQDIDLMMIANSTNKKELQIALDKITNISYTLPEEELNAEQFQGIRKEVYDLYIKSLTSKEEYFYYKYNKKRNIAIEKKIEFLIKSGVFDSTELKDFQRIINNTTGGVDSILSELENEFPKKMHQILLTMKDYSPIEKTGIIGTDIETYQNMFKKLDEYNSITIDENAKYGNVALADGTFDFRHLQKTLDFARDNGKQVRLNTLLFYKDCPEELYNLEPTQKNKDIVMDKLSTYVKQTTSFIRDNGYESTVRSIDVFNELLNRYPMKEDTPYQYRGDIVQDPTDDNTKSGWLKFLSVEELCKIIAIARENLPNTDFMYNDDNLIDPNKLKANTEIINKIRQYEKDNNIKLIDSIGTQMHIDDRVTKEQIINMFDTLKQFDLPIEVSEGDITMASDNIKKLKLSRVGIHNFKIQKMNEFFEAITECKERDNIRGITIWSKTDAQNFRVSLENEQRIKNGEEPIKTLYGGFYNKDMTLKKGRVKFQNFNYHTHTYRSGHSEYVSDEEMLKAAKDAGISMLGFSEHVPNPDLEFPDEDHRMMLSEVDGYIESINKLKLKEENKNMTILIGFEAEFDPMKEKFLGDMRKKVDYMILGQHFVKDGMDMVHRKGNPEYPLEYAKMVSAGINSGLFDIVAHPDCFMELRDTISDKDKDEYEQNCIKASKDICEAASAMGIPLEINLGCALNNKKSKDGNLGNPHPLFWKIAKEYDVKVLKGVDAHTLQAFEDLELGQERIANIEEMVSEKMIKGEYNPVIARNNNKELQEAYEKHQKSALPYETHLVSQIVTGASSVEEASKRCEFGKNKKVELLEKEISTIANSKELSTKDKNFKIERKTKALNETNKVFANQQRTIENTKNNSANDKSELQKMTAEQKPNSQSIEKPKTIRKTNNNQRNNTSSSGFADIITLSLIVFSVCGTLFMIVCMLVK